MISQVLKLARLQRHGRAVRARGIRRRRSDRGSRARRELRRRREGLQGARLQGAAKSYGARKPRAAAERRSRTCCATRCAIVRRARGWRSPSSAATTGLSIVDRRSRARRAAERLGAYISSRSTAWRNRAIATRGGEGIGLAITSQVMKAHGGSAKADNRARRRLRGAPELCRTRRCSVAVRRIVR